MKKLSLNLLLILSVVLAFGAVALAGDPDPKVIATEDAPAAIGPYSQGIKYGDLVFTSGQISLDPVDGVIPQYCVVNKTKCIYQAPASFVCPEDEEEGCAEGDITTQTRQVMENLQAILEAAKLSFDDVLMTTVYLASLDDFGAFNAQYGSYFTKSKHPPARATIAAGAIPKGALLEVSMIAGK